MKDESTVKHLVLKTQLDIEACCERGTELGVLDIGEGSISEAMCHSECAGLAKPLMIHRDTEGEIRFHI